jgi:hypothetical protein
MKARQDAYVIDYVGTAYLLSDDKVGFRKLPWVDSIIRKAIEHARWQ